VESRKSDDYLKVEVRVMEKGKGRGDEGAEGTREGRFKT
jgi:hypothetical protein